MNLNQITIPSQDVTKSIAFYKELGLKLIVHTHDAYARFECPDGASTLSINKVNKIPTGQGVIVYFEVPDVDKEVLRLRKKGIKFTLPPTDQSWLWREARLNDPDGNPIIIYYAGDNRKNPPWRIQENTNIVRKEPTLCENESLEIERKFLITSTTFKKEAHKSTRITQGYLSTDSERTVRVRIKGEKGFLTIKGKSNTSGTTRVEVEEEIALAKAQTLIKLCLPGIIDKTRYEVQKGNHLWEIDEFYGKNQGLVLAEIELTAEKEVFEKPQWIGQEVTGNTQYYNSQLSENPYDNW
jgi:CYTH domain-containing protein/catechol 2,3-dioxygenase-like lactoylglutathione lyase family enzyme